MQTPPVKFPSGFEPDFREGFNSPFIENDGFTHTLWLGGEMELPWPASRRACFKVGNEIAEACGYLVSRYGETGLLVSRGYGPTYYLKFSGSYVTSTLQDIITGREAIEREIDLALISSSFHKVYDLLGKIGTNCPEVRTHIADAAQALALALRDRENHWGIQRLSLAWDALGDVPLNYEDDGCTLKDGASEECIDTDFIFEGKILFPKGTPKLDTWYWFNAKLPEGLGTFLEQRSGDTK